MRLTSVEGIILRALDFVWDCAEKKSPDTVASLIVVGLHDVNIKRVDIYSAMLGHTSSKVMITKVLSSNLGLFRVESQNPLSQLAA